MPWIERSLSDLSRRLNPPARDLARLFEPGRRVIDAFQELGAVPGGRTLDFLEEWPPVLAEVFRTAIHAGLSKEPGLGHITLAWQPGYDYALHITETTEFEGSPGGLTIVVQSRYPYDPHPSRTRRRSRA
jgi:hypothetical protein